MAGAAIYAKDMTRCRWLGALGRDRTIFEITQEENSAFFFFNNTVDLLVGAPQGEVTNQQLATDASTIIANTDVRLCVVCVPVHMIGIFASFFSFFFNFIYLFIYLFIIFMRSSLVSLVTEK